MVISRDYNKRQASPQDIEVIATAKTVATKLQQIKSVML